MIQERALVLERTSKQAGKVWVRTQRQSACDSCKLKSGCGQSALNKLAGDKSMEFEVTNSLSASAGDVVILSIPEEGVLTASIIMYLMPLVLMLVSALMATTVWASDVATIIFGALGLLAGFWLARLYSQKHNDDPRFSPSMTSLALASPVDSGCV